MGNRRAKQKRLRKRRQGQLRESERRRFERMHAASLAGGKPCKCPVCVPAEVGPGLWLKP